MSKWEEIVLKEFVEKIGSGITPRGGSSVYIDKGTSLIRSQNVYNGLFTDKGLVYINESTALKMKSSEVLDGDVLLNITGDSVARCCLAPVEKLPARVNQHVLIIRTKKNVLNSKFLMYVLTSPLLQAQLLSFAAGKGATRKALTKDTIEKLKISVPDLTTQKTISRLLSNYDDLIKVNDRKIAVLEEIASRTHEKWFLRLKFPNKKSTDNGLVPDNWELCSAADLFTIQGGTQPPKSEWSDELKDGYTRMIQIRDYYSKSHIAYVKEKSNMRRCTAKDVMIARYGASVGRICWGLSGTYNVALVKVIPHDILFQEYIRWHLKSPQFQSKLLARTQRTAQDGFNKDTFKSIKMLMPEKGVIEKFNTIVTPIIELIEQLKTQNDKLNEARDILLPRLMTRMINVEQMNLETLQSTTA